MSGVRTMAFNVWLTSMSMLILAVVVSNVADAPLPVSVLAIVGAWVTAACALAFAIGLVSRPTWRRWGRRLIRMRGLQPIADRILAHRLYGRFLLEMVDGLSRWPTGTSWTSLQVAIGVRVYSRLWRLGFKEASMSHSRALRAVTEGIADEVSEDWTVVLVAEDRIEAGMLEGWLPVDGIRPTHFALATGSPRRITKLVTVDGGHYSEALPQVLDLGVGVLVSDVLWEPGQPRRMPTRPYVMRSDEVLRVLVWTGALSVINARYLADELGVAR